MKFEFRSVETRFIVLFYIYLPASPPVAVALRKTCTLPDRERSDPFAIY